MRIAVVQNNPRFGEVEANLDHVESMLRDHAVDVDLWVLPELFASGYLFTSDEEVAALAEPLEGGTTVGRLLRWARDGGAALVGGWPERDGDVFYNSAVLVTPEGIAAHYRKLHLFDRETMWFTPGDRPLPVVTVAGTRVGVMICYDWRFPEAARTLALAGAEVLAHPSNLVHTTCPEAMRTRALENRVYAATADRWGEEARGGLRLRYFGHSQVVDPEGAILGRLGDEGDGVLAVDVDPGRARDKGVTPHNDCLGDRRPSFYRLD